MSTCEFVNCAKKGCFEGDECPGSDNEEEVHHCELCGWLCWDAKSMRCDICHLNACAHCWQHSFVLLDECDEYEIEEAWEAVCFRCFMNNKVLWCTNDECSCSQKREKVQKEWDELQRYLKEQEQ